MAQRKITSSQLLIASLMQILALTTACGGGDGAKGSADAGSGGTSGMTSSEGGTATDTGGTGPGIEDGEGGTTNVGGSETGTPTSAPEFEGVDVESVPLEPTPGCVGGYDADAKSLALDIEEVNHSILIDAPEGYFRANGQVCTTADGTPMFAAEAEHLAINGSDADDVAIIDLLAGDLGNGLLGSDGAITLDLAGGSDKLVVRGTRGDDHMACMSTTSMPDSALRIDLGSSAHSLKATGLESILVSLGPGNDSFDGAESSLRCNAVLEIYGGADGDMLQGGSRDDVLNGGDGNDEFQMSTSNDGADVINGGADDDVISYARRSKDLLIRLCSAPSPTGCPAGECTCVKESGETNERDVIVNVEDAEGGGGNDTLFGDAGPNVLSGKDGNDRVQGLGGEDQLYGEAGDDTLLGGADGDILIGGSGKNELDGGDGDDICFISPRDTKKACETPVDVQ
jgi:Ca2+-binding RTX toxin-like protein